MDIITKPKTRADRNRSWLRPLILILIVAAIATPVYFYLKYRHIKDSPAVKGQQDAKAVIEAVGKLIDLPKDDVPTVATVTDPEAVKDQSFFQNAKKGDKVLIYSKANKAILYDPVAKKIVEIAPFHVGGAESSPPPAPGP